MSMVAPYVCPSADRLRQEAMPREKLGTERGRLFAPLGGG